MSLCFGKIEASVHSMPQQKGAPEALMIRYVLIAVGALLMLDTMVVAVPVACAGLQARELRR